MRDIIPATGLMLVMGAMTLPLVQMAGDLPLTFGQSLAVSALMCVLAAPLLSRDS